MSISWIGHTPTVKVDEAFSYYAKIEGANPFGSMKDRAATYVIEYLLHKAVISTDTMLVESSSGNWGIALAAVCKTYGLQFTCVTDPMIAPPNRKLLEAYGATIVCAKEKDANGSYVVDRLRIIQEMQSKDKSVFWINQYDNPIMIRAYEESLAPELLTDVPGMTHLVVPVSTCGCIAGLSRAIKKKNSNIYVVAVDVEGSHIFTSSSKERHIPGMGAPIPPKNLQCALIDRAIIVSELDCIKECRNLTNYGIMAGASSGACVAAMRRMHQEGHLSGVVVAIFPDRGERYSDTIYNNIWCQKNITGFLA